MLGRLAPPAGNGHSYDVKRLHKSGCQGEEAIQKCKIMRHYNWCIRGVNISAIQTFYKLKMVYGENHTLGDGAQYAFNPTTITTTVRTGCMQRECTGPRYHLCSASSAVSGDAAEGGCKDIQ